MLNSTDTKSIASLHSALKNCSIRSGRDASASVKASASLLAYFKALQDTSHNVASLDQLVAACEAVGLIEKPLEQMLVVGKSTVAQGLFKTSHGLATQQIRLMEYLYLPSDVDMLRIHKALQNSQGLIDKASLAMVQDICREFDNKSAKSAK